MKKYFSLLLMLIVCNLLSAQSVDAVMRSNQKIYVVTAVLTIILTGIIAFLFIVEKRLKELERK
jgi:heme/copper-type cytochrome/quinol oxidase subunit 4